MFLVGSGLDRVTRLKLTTANNTLGGDCRGVSGESHHQSRVFEVTDDSLGRTGFREVVIDGLDYQSGEPYYICLATDIYPF